jgi:hypothetical protein
MARLIDDIRRIGGLTMPWFVSPQRREAWEKHAAQLWRVIHEDPDIPVILIDNVAAYYYEGTSQENWDLSIHFPNLAPPFPLFWTEFRLPKMIRSETGDSDVSQICPNGRTGFLIFGSLVENVKGEGIPANAKWILSCEQWIDYGMRRDEIAGPHGTINLALDAEGRIIDRPFMQSFAASEHNEFMKAHMGWLHPVFLALSFMHCKNVRVVDTPVPPKLAKKFRAHHGFNPVAHKTLVIEPLKEILRREGRSGEVGLAKAMHICRGHFADYTQGKGLFGKYHGKYWIPSTVRGTKGKAAPAREIEVKV